MGIYPELGGYSSFGEYSSTYGFGVNLIPSTDGLTFGTGYHSRLGLLAQLGYTIYFSK